MQSCSCAANSEKARSPYLAEALNSIQHAFRKDAFGDLPPPSKQGMSESMFLPNDPKIISCTHLANTGKHKPDIISISLFTLGKIFRSKLGDNFDAWRTTIAKTEQGAKTNEKISWHEVNTILELKFSGKISKGRLDSSYNAPDHHDSKEDGSTECEAGMMCYYPHSMSSYDTKQDFLRNADSVLVNPIPGGKKFVAMILLCR